MPDVDVDDLYGLPFDQFVQGRNALARELRNAGQPRGAGQVAALKKPSVAAWAVNQLVRTQGRAVADLFEAGDGLRSAQDDVLAGRGDASSLRAAVERERLAVETLTDIARGLLTSEGDELSDTMIERVGDTLHAAALDDEAREQVSGGRLERELRHAGLGVAAVAGGSPTVQAEKRPAARKTASDAKKKTQRQPAGEGAAQERTAREQAQAREDARRAARVTEREARRRAQRAGRAANLAIDRREKAAEALREAEKDLVAAQAEVRAAEDALREAAAAVRESRP